MWFIKWLFLLKEKTKKFLKYQSKHSNHASLVIHHFYWRAILRCLFCDRLILKCKLELLIYTFFPETNEKINLRSSRWENTSDRNFHRMPHKKEKWKHDNHFRGHRTLQAIQQSIRFKVHERLVNTNEENNPEQNCLWTV